jgi:hypothetical protein
LVACDLDIRHAKTSEAISFNAWRDDDGHLVPTFEGRA